MCGVCCVLCAVCCVVCAPLFADRCLMLVVCGRLLFAACACCAWFDDGCVLCAAGRLCLSCVD